MSLLRHNANGRFAVVLHSRDGGACWIGTCVGSNESEPDDEDENPVSKFLTFDIQAEQRSIIKTDFIGKSDFYHICLR